MRRWPPRPPASSSPVEVLQDSPRVSSQHVTLGGCALGAAWTGGRCAHCGGQGAPVAGTGRVGRRCPLHPRAGAAGWPRAATSPCARACPSACTWVCVRVRSCVCACVCARGAAVAGGRCAERRGGWALSGRSVRLASLRRTDRSRSRLTRGDVDAADPQICPHEGPAWPKLPGSDAGSPAARHPTSASGQRGPVAEDSRGRVAP